MKKLFLIGAGGHCKSCIDVIESTRQFKISGLFDIAEKKGSFIGPYEVIGTDADIARFVAPDTFFLLTLGQIKSAQPREHVVATLELQAVQWATVISARAYVASTAKIGAGSIVMHDALVNSYGTVGRHCIINTKALVEHDSVVEDFCHVSTGAILNGNVVMGKSSFIGSHAVTQEGLRIPPQSVLGAGQFHRKAGQS